MRTSITIPVLTKIYHFDQFALNLDHLDCSTKENTDQISRIEVSFREHKKRQNILICDINESLVNLKTTVENTLLNELNKLKGK